MDTHLKGICRQNKPLWVFFRYPNKKKHSMGLIGQAWPLGLIHNTLDIVLLG